MATSPTCTTRRQFPLACDAIKAGKFKIEFIQPTSVRGEHPMCVVYAGPKVVADASTAGRALRWIEDHEIAERHALAERGALVTS
jgi:hypothetical protein